MAQFATDTRYLPGTWVGIVGAGIWLLADGDPADPTVARCWDLAQAGADVEAMREALASGRSGPVRHMAVVRVDGAQAEVAVHGAAWVELRTAGGPREVRATPGCVSVEKVDDVTAVSLRAPDDGSAAAAVPVALLPLGTGVVSAREMSMRLSVPADQDATRLGADDPVGSGWVGPRLGDIFGDAAPRLTEDEPDAVDEIPEDWLLAIRRQHRTLEATVAPAPGPAEEGPAPTTPDVESIDDVWSAVVSAGRGVGTSDPAAGPGPPPSPQVAVSVDLDPELLHTTVRPPAGEPIAGPSVDAVRCADGHLNPPAAERCRGCGGPVPSQAPQRVPRPPLGVLRLSTGEVIPLDRPVVLGRAPGVPQGFGPDEPYRIQVSSPDGSISRQHVEVVIDGWQVTVVDLESTNGTKVTSPDGECSALPSGGSCVIDDGYEVWLDAAVSCRYEVSDA
jgi:hypothetical protein